MGHALLLTRILHSLSFISDSPPVVLIFGSAKNKLMIHREVLVQIQYLKDVLENVKPEGDVIELDYSSFPKEAGNWLALWLYSKELPFSISEIAQLKAGEAVAVSSVMLSTYCLAVKLKMEEWANHLIDLFMAFKPTEIPLTEYWHKLRVAEADTRKLDDLVMRLLAAALHEQGWDTYTRATDTELLQSLRNGGDFAEEFAKHLLTHPMNGMKWYKRTSKCHYHIHESSAKC